MNMENTFNVGDILRYKGYCIIKEEGHEIHDCLFVVHKKTPNASFTIVRSLETGNIYNISTRNLEFCGTETKFEDGYWEV